MKILHTSDWHIGSKLNGVSRKEEQQAVLDEIVQIAQNKKVDVVLICGDNFHDIISSSYADKMIINTLIKLANNGERAVVVLLGNHDDAERLTASKHFAERENIFLVDSLNYDYGMEFHENFKVNLVECGKGFLKFKKGDEEMVVNLMPYPAAWFRKEKTLQNESLIDKLKRLYNCGANAFDKNTINVNIGHFFIRNEKQKSDIYLEIPEEIIPPAHYTALGHVHDYLEINPEKNIIYCGSPYQIFPADILSKFVVVADLSSKGVLSKELIRIKSLKKIVIINAKNYSDLLAKLRGKEEFLVCVNVMQGAVDADEIKRIRESYSNIITFNIKSNVKKKFDITKKDLTETEVFMQFYKAKFGKEAGKELTQTFENVINGGEDETD